MMTNPAFLLFSAAYAVSFPLLLLALIAVYGRQAGQAGSSESSRSAPPWSARRARRRHVVRSIRDAVADPGRAAGHRCSLQWQSAEGGLVGQRGLVLSGWMLFGAASWRAWVLPRGLSIGVAAGGLIGFQAAMPPWGVALGLGLAAVGIWLTRHDRIAVRVEAPRDGAPAAVSPSRLGLAWDLEDRRLGSRSVAQRHHTRKVHHVFSSHPSCLERARPVGRQRTTQVQPYSGIPG